MKKSSDTIRNRTRDFPACSAVPQATAPPAACPLFLYERCIKGFGGGTRWEKPTTEMWDIINMDLRKIGWECVDWIDLAEDRDKWRNNVHTVNSTVQKN